VDRRVKPGHDGKSIKRLSPQLPHLHATFRLASSARTFGRTQELDRAQDRSLRLVADRHLHEIAIVAENLVLSEDLGDRLSGRSDHQMATGAAALIELRARQGRPAALAPDAAHHLCVRREERLNRGFGRIGEKPWPLIPTASWSAATPALRPDSR
jgi:hypothetical protein